MYLGYITTCLSADQLIQFAGSLGLEVTLRSEGLSEDLLPRARAVSGLGGRGET